MRTFAKSKFKELWLKIDYSQDRIDNLKMFDLKLGNRCNLSCNICSPKSSSKVANIRVSSDIISNDEYQRISQLVNWNTSDQFRDQIMQLADNLLYLDIYGGEPFMNKAHFVLLHHLIDLGVSKNISIDYNTNGTIYSEKFFALWKEFKSVKVSFSIDDINDRFEFQRAGADWSSVCDNIARYNQKVSNNFATDIFATVNSQNVYYLPELLEWTTQQQCSQNISFNILTLPTVYAINNLSEPIKLKVQEKLQSHAVLQPIINFMCQDATADHNVVEHLASLTNVQGRSYFEVHHEFAKIVNDVL
jgi:MoaA/NifB/PqqE/SkfB family radical SAM enzyme